MENNLLVFLGMIIFVIIAYLVRTHIVNNQLIGQQNLKLINMYLHNKLLDKLLVLLNNHQESSSNIFFNIINKIKEYFEIDCIFMVKDIIQPQPKQHSNRKKYIITEILTDTIVNLESQKSYYDNQLLKHYAAEYVNKNYNSILNKISKSTYLCEEVNSANFNKIKLYFLQFNSNNNNDLLVLIQFGRKLNNWDSHLLFNQVKNIISLTWLKMQN